MLDLTVADRIAWVSLARSPVNALNDELIDALHQCLDALTQRDDWSVLAFRSSLKVFCAGADLTQIETCIQTSEGADLMVEIITKFQSLFKRIESLDAVTVAVIHGAALGGGLELALSCDLRIVADEAKLGLPEASLGVIPGAGGTQRLTRLCGKGVASRLILGAEVIDGQTAIQLGLAQWSAPRAELDMRACEILARIAQLDPEALALSKQCIAAASQADDQGFALEIESTRTLYKQESTRKLINHFLQKSQTK